MNLSWAGLIERLEDWFTARALFSPSQRWVLGVSGGPDSTLLLHAMVELGRRIEPSWALHVAHLHHGLRGEDADADEAFVRKLADELGLAFHHEKTDVRAAVARDGGSTEEVARQKRYEFLERIALTVGTELVAVAHHADDNAETLLHRVCRGTGLRGLAGMSDIRSIQPGSRVRLIRPLLQQRRSDIDALLRERGLAARQDSTNFSSEFTRGRIRNEIMPLLRDKLNPNVSEALLRLGEQARWLGTYLEDAAERVFDSLVISESPGRIVLNTNALLSKQRIIQAEVVRRALSLVLGREQDLGFAHIDAVLKLAADSESGKVIHLPGSVLARRVYERLEFLPIDSEPSQTEMLPVFVSCPGLTELPLLAAQLRAEVVPVTADKIGELRTTAHPYEEWLDLERVQMPLLVRGRREGDRFWPLGAPGSKRLSDFFGDEKVDPHLRARMGILCDQAGPVWVMPLRIDERVKLRPTTRQALRLELIARPNGHPVG